MGWWLPRLALAGIGLAVALVVIEIVLRAFPGLMPPQAAARAQLFRDLGDVATRPDPYIGFLYPPNTEATMRHRDVSFTFRTDAHGFRNAGPWPERPDVVAVGDSVTFGFGIPDGQGWVDVVARRLDARIVNLALPGFGPIQYLRVYERFGAALKPPVVLVGLFPGNDFWDTAKFQTWLERRAGGNYLLWRDFGVTRLDTAGTIEKLVKSTSLYSMLWAIRHIRGTFRQDAIIHETKEGPLTLLPRALRGVRQRAAPGQPEFEDALAALKALERRVRADGGRMVVVVLPSKEYVYLPLEQRLRSDPFEHVYEALDELRLTYVDVTPALRQRAAAGEALFFEIDGHPNERGYAVIGDVVAEHLQSDSFGKARGRRP